MTKYTGMEQNAAEEHLQVIRTLMERSALYRRTLAPIMLYVGGLGVVAAVGGVALGIDSPRAFCAWWLAAAAGGLAVAFFVARRQAHVEREPLWSPPALRAAQAIAPPLMAGLVFSVALVAVAPSQVRWLFVPANALFYGCAAHAAGFFISRGTRVFGWLVIAAAAVLVAFPMVDAAPSFRLDHALMGLLFGLLHLAWGAYLNGTDRRKTVA